MDLSMEQLRKIFDEMNKVKMGRAIFYDSL